ncbi:hypothetical protein [Catellatospora sp. NPDC049133]|uniref:hypothetical protein n=1 Tax=Catellatospora sp. NPDC049133 TaxID=3155499 RepID=UPI0033EF8EEC
MTDNHVRQARRAAYGVLSACTARDDRAHITWAVGAGLLTHSLYFWAVWHDQPPSLVRSGRIGEIRRYAADTSGIRILTADQRQILVVRWPDITRLMSTVPEWRRRHLSTEMTARSYYSLNLDYARDATYGFANDTERAARAEADWLDHETRCARTAAEIWLSLRPAVQQLDLLSALGDA